MADILLVHGLWNRGWSMAAMARRLRAKGHTVMVFSYPTRRSSLDQHADSLREYILQNQTSRAGSNELHLAGHSLGGLVILNMFARYADLPAGRVVMMGTPVKGAAVVKSLEKLPGQSFLFGKIKQGLLEGFQLPPQGHETGMIAGTRAFGFGQIVGQHAEVSDGSVTVRETFMDGLKDRIELEVAHTEMLISSEVVFQLDQFITYGKFKN